jgi:hypothetical protein
MVGGVTVEFNDTSQFLHRNSSTKRGGFEGNLGNVKTTTDLDVDGTEDIMREQEQLSTTERNRVAAMIGALTVCATDQLCGDKADLKTRAGVAWDRAVSLYPEHKAQLDLLLDDLKVETINRICLAKNQWARTAGSSLNCLVQSMETKAQVELARRISGIIAESHMQFRQHETEAIVAAFDRNMSARLEPMKLGLNQIGTLYSVLRGAVTTDVTDRNYTEARDESTNQFTAMGKFFHEASSISASEGTFAGDADNAALAAQAIAGIL